METSQVANLGDLAALLQIPAQGGVQAQSSELKGNTGKPFSQIMQQLNAAGGDAHNPSHPLLSMSETTPLAVAVTSQASALTSSQLMTLNDQTNGNPLPGERQLVAAHDDTTDLMDPMPLVAADEDVIDVKPIHPLIARATENDGAYYERLKVDISPAAVGVAVGAGFGETAKPLIAGQASAASVLPDRANDAAHASQHHITQSSLLDQVAAEAGVERASNVAKQTNADGDGDTAVKTALPFELPKKSLNADESGPPVTRSIEGLSSVGLSRASAVAPAFVPSNQPGLAEKAVSDAFTEKVVWMTGQGAQRANLQLHPAELGALQIRVTMMDNSAHVEIHAQNAETSDMLETLLPKLQSALEQQGLKVDELKLNPNTLFAESGGDKSRRAFANDDNLSQGANAEDPETEDSESAVITPLNPDSPGSVDFYA